MNNEKVMTTGEDIRNYRKAHGLSMKKLADCLLSPTTKQPPHLSTIGLWENGKSPIPQWAREQMEKLVSVHRVQEDNVKPESETKKSTPGKNTEGCLVIEFGPEAKSFLGALIRAIVVDPEDIKDPVVRGFLKYSERR